MGDREVLPRRLLRRRGQLREQPSSSFHFRQNSGGAAPQHNSACNRAATKDSGTVCTIQTYYQLLLHLAL